VFIAGLFTHCCGCGPQKQADAPSTPPRRQPRNAKGVLITGAVGGPIAGPSLSPREVTLQRHLRGSTPEGLENALREVRDLAPDVASPRPRSASPKIRLQHLVQALSPAPAPLGLPLVAAPKFIVGPNFNGTFGGTGLIVNPSCFCEPWVDKNLDSWHPCPGCVEKVYEECYENWADQFRNEPTWLGKPPSGAQVPDFRAQFRRPHGHFQWGRAVGELKGGRTSLTLAFPRPRTRADSPPPFHSLPDYHYHSPPPADAPLVHNAAQNPGWFGHQWIFPVKMGTE